MFLIHNLTVNIAACWWSICYPNLVSYFLTWAAFFPLSEAPMKAALQLCNALFLVFQVEFEAHTDGHRHYTLALLLSPFSFTTTAVVSDVHHWHPPSSFIMPSMPHRLFKPHISTRENVRLVRYISILNSYIDFFCSIKIWNIVHIVTLKP